jgi:hypothetical protein
VDRSTASFKSAYITKGGVYLPVIAYKEIALLNGMVSTTPGDTKHTVFTVRFHPFAHAYIN